MDIRDVIYSRRAARAFTAQQVMDDLLKQLIDAAIQALERTALVIYRHTRQGACSYDIGAGEEPCFKDDSGRAVITSPGSRAARREL
jgi:hypothetical protein